MKLFIIPFAGGMSNTYLTWEDQISNCQVIPIVLKGRENRICENLYSSFEEAVCDVKNQILKIIDEDGDDEFALFGHSMGALLAYEVYYALKKEYVDPGVVFISGRRPPVLGNETKPVYKYLPEDLKKEMISNGGMNPRFFDNEELVELFIPIIRADYKILYEYKYRPHQSKMKCKVVILNGQEDELTDEEMLMWNDLSEKKVKYYLVPGNHFFTLNNPKELFEIIETEIDSL